MVGTVNANREYFESGVRDVAQAQAQYPGWLPQLLTNPGQGLENFAELFNQLTGDRSAIKVYCEIAQAVIESQPDLEAVTAAYHKRTLPVCGTGRHVFPVPRVGITLREAHSPDRYAGHAAPGQPPRVSR